MYVCKKQLTFYHLNFLSGYKEYVQQNSTPGAFAQTLSYSTMNNEGSLQCYRFGDISLKLLINPLATILNKMLVLLANV